MSTAREPVELDDVLYRRRLTGAGAVRYDPVLGRDVWDCVPPGVWLLRVAAHGSSLHALAEPVELDYAGVLAALEECGEAMVAVLQEANRSRPERTGVLTPQARAELDAWAARHGVDISVWRGCSMQALVDAGLDFLAERLRASALTSAAPSTDPPVPPGPSAA